LFARISEGWAGGVTEVHKPGVGGKGRELSEGSSREQETISGVHWVSVSVGCIMVGSESRSAVECRARLEARERVYKWWMVAPMATGGEKPEMQGPSNQIRDSGENREMMQSCVETLSSQGFIGMT
jgi:hypothetical protein